MSVRCPNQTLLISRHLACDLDRVEERAFWAALDRDPQLRSAFAEAHEALVQKAGLSAFAVRNPDVAHCFSTQTLEQFVRGELGDVDRQTVASHLPCPLCSSDVEHLIDRGAADRSRPLTANGAPSRTQPAMPPARRRSPRARTWPRSRARVAMGVASVAASVALVVGLSGRIDGPSFQGAAPSGSGVLRDSSRARIRAQLSEETALAREACVLRWSTDLAAEDFDVKVFTEDLEPIAGARSLKAPRFVIPEEALRKVPSQALLLWQVTARHADGTQVVSPTFRSRLR